MSRPPTVAQPILDGNALIYLRPRSSVWQCRFKVGKEWVVRSTGERDRKAAIDKVQEMYFEAKFRQRDGLQVAVGKTFGTVANLVIKELSKSAAPKSDETVAISQLTRFWIPKLGRKNINNITYDDQKAAFEEYFKETDKELGAKTVDDYNVALMRVFNRAVQLKAMSRAEIPELYKGGYDSTPRPAFTKDEFDKLCEFMLAWVEESDLTARQRAKRWLMLRYVYFIAQTGVRPGTETDSMKWSSINIFEKNSVKYASVYVDGKTGSRTLVADATVAQLLEQIRVESTVEVKDDHKVWLLNNGKAFSSPAVLFKELLTAAGLLVDPLTNAERTLYSLRHYYATQQLLASVPMHTLAKNMGTSVIMLERHYSKLTPIMAVEQLVQKR